MKKPDFSTWERQNLVKLCEELYEELRYLRADLKTAIEAYRKLNKGN